MAQVDEPVTAHDEQPGGMRGSEPALSITLAAPNRKPNGVFYLPNRQSQQRPRRRGTETVAAGDYFSKGNTMPTKEEKMQLQLVQWMDAVHPDVYYRSDLGGVRVSMGLAMKLKRLQKYRGHPDFTVYEHHRGYPVLMLELKAEEQDVFLKRGGLPSGKAAHLIEQAAMILMLRGKGYAADLVIGKEQAEWSIDSYLSNIVSYTINVDRILTEATPQQLQQAAMAHPVVAEYVNLEDYIK